MSYNPNLSFYVLGPYNQLSRIQGIVGKRGQNVVVKMKTKVNTTKYEFDYVYSLDKDTLINDADKGYIKAKDLTRSKSKILNAMNGRQSLDVEHRYRTEMFYDLILEAGKDKEIYPWFDANHNCWVSPNYTIPKNLFGKDILT
jgi:hypothetical protein